MESQLPVQQPARANQKNDQDLDEGEHQSTPKHQTMVRPRINRVEINELAHDCLGEQFYPDDEDLEPGRCGYFDSSGHWKNICNLTILPAGSVPYRPLREVPRLNSTPPQEWGPVPGVGVRMMRVKGEAETSMPVTAGAGFNFMRTRHDGALLMADPVTYHSYTNDSPFSEWLRDNERALVMCQGHRYHIPRYGLCIITEAYTTARCTISHWDGQTTEIDVAFTADALNGALSLTGRGTWNKISGGGFWRGFGFDDTRQAQQFTILVGGIKYSPNWYWRALEAALESVRPLYRGRSFILEAEYEESFDEPQALGDESEESDHIISDFINGEDETEL
ncbi:hypothetical protein BDV33DRAFT_206880 [Aspergillus novoparasiticus]|uniref:Uncharacterized protein n=1 Tax=Aspergillus novoparasiticus TaxID=986946 RepID=A0A5N6EIY8_9EURO|nr:hypothetical protein BDV33DRAFT_206880 [Aspergillus novoparasiticus]